MSQSEQNKEISDILIEIEALTRRAIAIGAVGTSANALDWLVDILDAVNHVKEYLH